MLGICDSAQNRILFARLVPLLAAWPKPVINSPRSIPTTERSIASDLLQGVSGLLIPTTRQASRLDLQAIGAGQASLPDLFKDCDFPIILRPVGSHAGRDLAKIECAEEIAAYLSLVDITETEFFVARFVDYRGTDGLFRKARVALIDGRAYACHMALSANWMIHYVNANMYEDAWKRSQEIGFMEQFDDFVQRHGAALEAIHQRTGLDYLCIDCAEAPDGQLLIFEIDNAMVVHAMDTEELFPYKQHYMQKVKNAFREFLLRLTADQSPVLPA
jgi:glutathione synthase/RimK-type ligase-like ATP-grasp enzyme